MKIFMLSTDDRVFVDGSETQKRLAGYGAVFDRLVLIVKTKRGSGYSHRSIAPNVEVYPTNSLFRLLYPFDIVKIGKQVGKGNAPAIISAQDAFEVGFAGWRLARYFSVPLQLQVHVDFLSPFFRRSSLINFLRTLLACFLLKRAQQVRVVSQRIRRELEKKRIVSAERIVTLPIFIDQTRLTERGTGTLPVQCQGKRLVLMVSRLTKEKNIGLAIRAVAVASATIPDVLLGIVGTGSEQSSLETMARRLRAPVVFIPWTEAINVYYQAAEIFISTSDYEGYGRSIIEAMFSGKAVIVTDAGVAGELVRDGENGIVVPVRDEVQLVAALDRLLTNPVEQRRLSEAARKTLEDLPDWPEYLARYREIFSRITSK